MTTAADSWTKIEQRLARWRGTAIVAAVAIVAGLLYGHYHGHYRDAGRDRELVQLHALISRDSSQRVAAVAHTDTAMARADTAVQQSRGADSSWTHARTLAERAHQVATSTAPDTEKVHALVTIVDTLRVAGDSLRVALVRDTAAIVQLRVAIGGERAAWSTERQDLQHALTVSEAQHRHWGLGITAGAAVVRDPDGSLHSGPGVTIGITYRW